jgi:hypothetical protein
MLASDCTSPLAHLSTAASAKSRCPRSAREPRELGREQPTGTRPYECQLLRHGIQEPQVRYRPRRRTSALGDLPIRDASQTLPSIGL